MASALAVNQCFELRGETTEIDMTCSVCLNYFSSPKTLPCGHSFCGVCIKRIVQLNLRVKIYCPKCKAQHTKHTLTNRLKLNHRLQRAVMKLQNKQIPKFLPKDLILTERIQSNGRFFKDRVISVTLLANDNVCFTTNSGLYCHKRSKGLKTSLIWRKELPDITSISSSEKYIFATQKMDKIAMVDERYTSWAVRVLDYDQGDEIRILYGGLGQECRITALPDGWLAITDTGSYSFHAQPCLILMTDHGEEKQVLTVEKYTSCMIKPTKVLASTDRSQFLIFDGGDNYLKCYHSFETALKKSWQGHARNYVTMATDATNSVIVVLMKESINIMTFNGETISNMDFRWDKEVVRDVSISERYLAVCMGKEACVYNIISSDDSAADDEM